MFSLGSGKLHGHCWEQADRGRRHRLLRLYPTPSAGGKPYDASAKEAGDEVDNSLERIATLNL